MKFKNSRVDPRNEQVIFELEKAWAQCLPDHTFPSDGFTAWLSKSDVDTVLYAIEAGGRKSHFLKGAGAPIDKAGICRYISSVLRNRLVLAGGEPR